MFLGVDFLKSHMWVMITGVPDSNFDPQSRKTLSSINFLKNDQSIVAPN